MLTCGLPGEAACLQSGAQVPNRPNSRNNVSTGAVLSAGMAVAAARTMTVTISMPLPLHRLEKLVKRT
jgi:hypothetical protein